MTHFCAVGRTLASWSSSEKLFCCRPCVCFSSLPELAALGMEIPAREESPSRAGLDGSNGGVRDRPDSSFPVSVPQAPLRAAALILGLVSGLDGQSKEH